MSRVINTANPGTERNRLRRTIAEILRHLMFKRSLDDETRDMAAALVYALRGIAETVEVTVEAWEKRNYFLKADRFRLEWEWALRQPPSARADRRGRWDRLPDELAALAPHFADIRISRMMRDASTWKASYELLLQEQKETP